MLNSELLVYQRVDYRRRGAPKFLRQSTSSPWLVLHPHCSETHQICWTVEQFHAWGCSWGQNLDTPTVTTFTIWDIPPYIARFYVCKVRSHFFAVTLPCCPVDFVVNFHQKPVLGTARVIATDIPTYSSMLDPII